MNRTIKKTIHSFLILAFLLNLVLPIQDASCMTGPWWSGSQGTGSTGVASAPPGEGSLNDNRKNQEQAGEPVSVHNGDFIYQHQDLLIPSRSMPTEINRIYKSQSRYNNRFGYGWDISYNKRIIPLCNGDLFYLNGELNRYRFIYIDGANYISPKGIYDKIVQNADGTYTLTEKHGTAYKFDQNGVLTEITDRNGNSLHFTYDPNGKLPIIGKSVFSNDPDPKVIACDYALVKITDTVGREVTLNYNSNGRVESIIDFSGRTYAYTYDPSGNGDLISFKTPATEEYPAGLTTAYSYTDHNLETITDAKGETYLTNHYDASDKVYRQEYGGSTFAFSYDTANNKTTVTDPKGFVTEWSYNSDGSPISKKEYATGLRPLDPASYTTAYQYNSNNLERASITYPAGNGIKYTYVEGNPDPRAKGNISEIRRKLDMAQPDDNLVDLVTAFTYEPRLNFIKTLKDPKGNTTTCYYDYEEATLGDLNGDGITNQDKSNLVKISYPAVGAVTSETKFTYNAFGQVETITDANGVVKKYIYYESPSPQAGYLWKTINDYGISPNNLNYVTEYSYDAVGNIGTIKNARGNTATFQHNALDQLVRIVSPAPFNYVAKYHYDRNGNLEKIERQANEAGTLWQTTGYTYNTADRLKTITDNSGNVTTYDYDPNGNRNLILDAELHTTTYIYDERNLLWKVTQHNEGRDLVTEYSYDENGNLKEIKDARGNKTTYDYDDYDRLEAAVYQDATQEQYDYDKNSNLETKANRRNQAIYYDYDELNRLIEKGLSPKGTVPDSVVTYDYDKGSRLTDVVDTNGTLHYDYDTVNRVKQVTYPGNKSISYEYDAASNRIKLTYPDSNFITYDYDELNRLTYIKDDQPTPVAIAHYDYDALSRRKQLDYANNTQAIYAYDGINRLTSLLNQKTTPELISRYEYPLYDKVGNRKSMVVNSADTHAYTYDDIYQLKTVDYPAGFTSPDMAYNYDDAGNRTSTVNGGTVAYVPNNVNQYDSVGAVAYTYDDDGNLTNFATNTYSYDSENRLIAGTVPDRGLSLTYKYDPFGRRIEKSVNGVITKFLYDGDQIIAEYDGSDNLTAKYIYGAGIDEVLKGLSPQGTVPEWYYHYDGLGSVTAITNSSGAVIESYSYDVFGKPATTSTIGNRYMFTGREYDAETGLYYYRARYYSAELGRFLQTDPIGYLGGMSLYTYCDNNPVNYFDPFGEDTYYINNEFGKSTPTNNPIRSHSFVAITDRDPVTGKETVTKTHSWVPTNGGEWEDPNKQQNIEGAQKAIDTGVGAYKKGDESLDSYIEEEYENRKDEEGGFWPGLRGTCKNQGKKLISDAKKRRALEATTKGKK